MSLALAAILLPLLAALPLGFFGTPLQGARASLGVVAVVFVLSIGASVSRGYGLVRADDLGVLFGMLSGFVGLTTAAANLAFVRGEAAALSLRRWRVYHAMGQVMLSTSLLGLYADNIGLLWVAVEGATIAGTLGASLSGTPSALEAAWKYFILVGVGIALALFGTMLTYLAAQPALGPGFNALSFAALSAGAAHLDGALLTLAFVFLLFGYGTKAALAPLHGWLPDAYAEGPAPLTTCLSGLTLNVALLALLRFRHLLQANFLAGGGAMRPGPLLLTLGLASILLTAFSLARRRDARCFFGFSSIGQSGLTVFAFGLGGAAAIFGGLLHMLLHTLLKSALFQTLIRAAALRGGAGPGQYGFSRLRGLLASNRTLGWLLGCGVFALAGLPPSGLFVSAFIIVGQTIQRQPLLSLPLGLGLVLCAIAVLRLLGPLLFARAPKAAKPAAAGRDVWLVGLQLGLMLVVAYAMPLALVRSLSGIAAALQ